MRFKLAFLMTLWLINPVLAESDSWKIAREKMTSSDGYSLNYQYSGPEGTFYFKYTCQGDGTRILTEVLEGSARGAGTRIYFDPQKDADNVFMETRFVTLRRSLEARDIKGSSLYQSLFRLLVQDLSAPEPSKVLEGQSGGSILIFGETSKAQDRLQLDKDGNPVNYRRLEGGEELKSMKFENLKWGFHKIEWEK